MRIKKDIKNLVPKKCELRCGAKYTLLRDEFYKEKSKAKKFRTQNLKFKIFLAMGGANSSNLKKLQRYTKNKEWIKSEEDYIKLRKNMVKYEDYLENSMDKIKVDDLLIEMITPKIKEIEEKFSRGEGLGAFATVFKLIDLFAK